MLGLIRGSGIFIMTLCRPEVGPKSRKKTPQTIEKYQDPLVQVCCKGKFFVIARPFESRLRAILCPRGRADLTVYLPLIPRP